MGSTAFTDGEHRDEIDPAAAVGFDRQALSYSRVRPGYPPQVMEILLTKAGFAPGAKVVDIGAGTGIFTRELIGAGMDVIAVDPVEGMRQQFAVDTPGSTAVDGTAERLPLDAESVDGATAAQCFHWFDPQPALREVHRVLRPGAPLALVWNARDESVAWLKAWGDLVAERGGGRPYEDHREVLWEDVVGESGLFTPLQSETMHQVQIATPEQIVDRARSVSFVAALPPDRHASALAAVRDLIATHPDTAGRDQIEFPYDTHVYWCRRID